MPIVEVFAEDEMTPLFQGEFSFMPRRGEYISKDVGGYFSYYNVIEVWHREEGGTELFGRASGLR